MYHRYFLFLLLGVFSTSFVACHHHHDEEEHHHDAITLTAYSDHFEVYAETEPLLVDQQQTVLLHLTRLEDFRAAADAAITLLLDGQPTDSEVHPSSTAGIYHITLIPKDIGAHHLSIVIHCRDVIDTVAFPVQVFATHEAMHSHEGDLHHDEEEADGILFTKEQSWHVDFATEVLQPRPFDAVIRTSAQILPSQGGERVVTAKSSGIVMLPSTDLVEGAAVRAGQQLCNIESSEMVDNNMVVRLQQAKSTYDEARVTYERQQQLAQDRIVSQSDLQRSRSRYEEAKALYENLTHISNGHGTHVESPISGFVREWYVRSGSYVEAGQPLMVIAQNRDLLVRAEVPPRYYAQLQHISSAHFLLHDSVYTLESLEGSLVSYGHATEAESMLIPVIFRVRNHAGWIPGTFLTAYILTTADRQALSVPNEGIVEEMGNYFVFVQLTPERFEKRLVSLGATDGLHTEVISGLHAGERVVTRGAMLIKLAQSTATLDPHAGHVHSH